ncbi:GNAT family protein [Flavobacteriaceae bacterium S356]|uniref:GNAT family protein n=1 Tax=Asprobacillus argus TaxID=3076534 RepID=A0ABU3LDN7_9FLAO|nr:GNAT family protein [Flavobacteriaceae bacterium S356]
MKLNFKEDIILENDRVRLEPLTIEHVELLTPIAIDNPTLLKYSPPKFGTVDYLKEYIIRYVKMRTQHLIYAFAIYDKQKSTYAGSTSFMNISQVDERLEIGSTWIGKTFQRTGLNRHCKYLLMQYVFETLQFERLELRTDERNIQSQTAIKAIGGQYEGTLRGHLLMSDGFRRNTVCYSILKDEWKDIKSTIFKTVTE